LFDERVTNASWRQATQHWRRSPWSWPIQGLAGNRDGGEEVFEAEDIADPPQELLLREMRLAYEAGQHVTARNITIQLIRTLRRA
jgi:hypothetical protein